MIVWEKENLVLSDYYNWRPNIGHNPDFKEVAEFGIEIMLSQWNNEKKSDSNRQGLSRHPSSPHGTYD